MKKEIRRWLEENQDELSLSNFSLDRLAPGESNETFRAYDGDRELIVRTSKEDSEDRIAHERDVLRFLEQQNIDNVPRLVHYEEDTSLGQAVIVESSVGKEDLDIEEATPEQVENLAEMIAQFHSISVEEYNQFFGTEHPSSVTLEKELELDFEKYSKKPYEDYRKMAEDVDQRVEEFYEKQKELIKEAAEIDVEVTWTFVNGDIMNNVRQEKDEVYIVDWELAGVGVPYIELIEFFTSGKISEEKQDALLEEYEKRYELPEDWRESAELIEKFHGFNSMIWAAKKKEQREEPKYNKMFEQRMAQLEQMWRE
ncbi:MAG: aminoglycoside phosphotransferase family protein [Candidatus Nanohalobium sp.]